MFRHDLVDMIATYDVAPNRPKTYRKRAA